MLAVLRKHSKVHLAILVNNLVYTISPSATEMLGETKRLLEKFSTWWSRPVVTTESVPDFWFIANWSKRGVWVAVFLFRKALPIIWQKPAIFWMFVILVGVLRVGLGEKLNTWKKPRAMVHGPVVFLQSRINIKMPDVNGGWFRTSDLQRRKFLFASVAGFWGGNAGEVKFMVIWPRGFGVAHALQAKTIPILKVSVLCPDWRYAKSLQCFYYSSAYTHTHRVIDSMSITMCQQQSKISLRTNLSNLPYLWRQVGRAMTPDHTLTSCKNGHQVWREQNWTSTAGCVPRAGWRDCPGSSQQQD